MILTMFPGWYNFSTLISPAPHRKQPPVFMHSCTSLFCSLFPFNRMYHSEQICIYANHDRETSFPKICSRIGARSRRSAGSRMQRVTVTECLSQVACVYAFHE